MFFLVSPPTELPGFRHIRYCGCKRNERVENMKKFGFRAALAVLLWVLLCIPTWAADVLIPVGRAVGLELEAAGLAVAELDPDLGSNARDAGLQEGDIIIKVDGQPVHGAASLQEALDRSKGALVLTILRDGEERNLTMTPVERDGQRRLGIYVREGIAGVGTVTYYDPESGTFGALGHGVSDPHGNLLPLEAGTALEAEVVSVKKGRVGAARPAPGGLSKRRRIGNVGKKHPLRCFRHSACRLEWHSLTSGRGG